MLVQVRAFVNSVAAHPTKFNVSGLDSTAEGGHPHIPVYLVGIADIINSPFQYELKVIYISKQQFDELIDSLDLWLYTTP